MDLPETSLEAAAEQYARAIVALREGRYAEWRRSHDTAEAVAEDAFAAADLADPWQPMRLIGEVLPAELARMVNERKG